MQFITISEFARREGCSRTLVQKAIRDGKLTPDSGGLLAADLVGTAWRRRRHAHAEFLPPDAAKAAERILSVQGAPWSQAEADRVKANFLALLRKLEYEQRCGELLSQQQVEEAIGVIIDAQRTAFLHLPNRAAVILAGETDQVRIKVKLTEMVHQILAELAETEFVPVDGQLVQRTHRSSNGHA